MEVGNAGGKKQVLKLRLLLIKKLLTNCVLAAAGPFGEAPPSFRRQTFAALDRFHHHSCRLLSLVISADGLLSAGRGIQGFFFGRSKW